MKDIIIKNRLNELCEKDCLKPESVVDLFNEYERDKQNNIPIKDSMARTILILGNDKIVFFVLKNKIGLNYISDTSEEVSIGRFALIKAVDTFKVNSGVKFSSYAIKVIQNEILMYYRKDNTRIKNQISLEDYLNNQDDKDKTLRIIDTLRDNEDSVKKIIDKELINVIIKNIKYLNDDEKTTIIYSFGLFGKNKLPQREIAKIINKSRTYVSKCLKTGTKKLKVLSLSECELDENQIILKKILINRASFKDMNEKFI